MTSFFDKLTGRLTAPKLTRGRIALVIAVALVADLLQIVLLPLEWMFIQQIVDVIAMGLAIWLLGFHVLLLPTFAVEFIPVVDMLPTWTACVVAVIALRKREQRQSPLLPPANELPAPTPPPRQLSSPPSTIPPAHD
ncbi:MAG: hypothetical protein V9H26_05140 [Verrucomicrobiota bacterium]|nr:hypothetical protein [Verrucomicrobiota bacterium]MCC6823062.1 hypothetical protein [Limisphaerales bacterium]